MKEFFERNKKLLQTLNWNILVVLSLVAIIHLFGIEIVPFKYIFTAILFFLFFLFSSYEKKYFKYPFVFLIILIILETIYSGFLQEYQYYLMILGIFFGLLSFDFKKKEKEENENEDEKKKDKYWKTIWILFLIFILLKISFPLIYTGGYIGEYYNILAGAHWFEHGELAIYYEHGNPYVRGMFVSFVVGLVTSIFGESIFALKMIPATTGILSFLLLLSIAKRILKNPFSVLALMTVYTFSPFVIFNHFFIRFYAFYELFLLFHVWLFLKIDESFKLKNLKNLWTFLTIFLASNIFVYLTANDTGRYAVILISVILISFVFFNYKNVFKKKYLEILNLDIKKKLLIFLPVVLIGFLWLDGPYRVEQLLYRDLTYPADPEYGFSFLFLQEHLLYTTLFLLGVITTFVFFKDKISKVILLCPLTILFLFSISSQDLELIRAMMFFLGLFFLGTFVFIDNVYNTSKHFYGGLIILVLVLIPFTYPEDFLKEPHLPGESGYTELTKGFNYLKEAKPDAKIISVVTSLPNLSSFHSVDTDVFLMSPNAPGSDSTAYYSNSFVYYGNIPIVNSVEKFSEEDFCIIIREPASAYYLLEEHRELIKEEYIEEKEEFKRFSIYCNY